MIVSKWASVCAARKRARCRASTLRTTAADIAHLHGCVSADIKRLANCVLVPVDVSVKIAPVSVLDKGEI